MAASLYITILYIISFLDTLCFGLIMPVLPLYILKLGGNHKVLGLLSTSHILLQSFAVPLAQCYSDKYGRKVWLVATLIVGALSNIAISAVMKFQSIIIIRLIFFLVNQTQSLCKAFVADIEAREEHDLIYSKMNLLGVLSFIIGPIIGGYVFGVEQGFYYISLITGGSTLLAVLLALILPNDRCLERPTGNLAEKLANNFTCAVRSLNLQFGTYWNIILMKIYVTTSMTVFFMKFPLLLSIVHHQGYIAIGCTFAYQSLIIFLTTFFVPLSEKLYEGQNVKRLSHSISLLTISMANICYAPTFPVYLICFVPLSLAKSIFESTFKEITSNPSLGDFSKGLDTISTLTSIAVPVTFGYFCDIYSYNALKAFSIIPLVMSMLLMHFFSKKQFTKLKLN
ncbi:hypothetical protein Trydic_g5270 [Trypoxylus dichotomus]